MNDPGYLIEENILSIEECSTLIGAIENSNVSQNLGGVRHLMANATVRDIANDKRLRTVASNFLGETAIPYKATLFSKTGKANWLVAWHQDTALPIIKADLNS